MLALRPVLPRWPCLPCLGETGANTIFDRRFDASGVPLVFCRHCGLWEGIARRITIEAND